MQFIDIKTAFVSFRGQSSNAYHGDVATATVPSDDDLYINFAYEHIAKSSKDWPWLENTDQTLDSVANQQEYDFPSTILHPRVVKVDDIICQGTTKEEVLMINDYNSSPISGTPRYYYVLGNGSSRKIGFHPVKSSNGTNDIYIYGNKPITYLSSDSSVPLFQSTSGQEYLSVLLTGAYYYFLLKDTDDINRQRHSLSVFTLQLDLMKKDMLKKKDELYSISMRPKRGMIYPPEGHIPRTPYP